MKKNQNLNVRLYDFGTTNYNQTTTES